ncbi:MAG: TIGR00730 family Rossman fold protein [Candidatus Omnitrophica bacterium]|nr:TIGR00730 family Rossman fold protein [Candidatus Omnitrophota bacterium]
MGKKVTLKSNILEFERLKTTFKESFIRTDTWRIFRIMSEFVEGFEGLSCIKQGVSFFGSRATPVDHPYYKLAYKSGYTLTKKGYTVITGAGGGIMEAANKGAKKAGGVSVGLNILIPQKQVPNPYINYLIEFKYFFVRKVMFTKHSYAFVVFPGGYGTLDEVFENLSLVQTRRIEPVPVILVNKAYWSGLLNWLQTRLIKDGAIRKKDLNLFTVVETPEEIHAAIKNFYSRKRVKGVKSRRGEK